MNIRQKFDKFFQEMKAEASKLILEELNKIFTEHPYIESFGFIGMTPYFNDGEPCYYGVYNYLINGVDEYNDEDYGELIKLYPEAEKAYRSFQQIIGGIPEEILEAAFDNDMKTTFHRDGTITKEIFDNHD